jgi:hypothetical protein
VLAALLSGTLATQEMKLGVCMRGLMEHRDTVAVKVSCSAVKLNFMQFLIRRPWAGVQCKESFLCSGRLI